MRFLLAILLTAALSFIAGKFLPWWSIAVVSFLVAILIRQNLAAAFWAGFLGVFFSWAIVAWWIDMKNAGILSHKVAELFHLGGSSILLILVTGIIGGLVGGFAAMSGGSFYSTRAKS